MPIMLESAVASIVGSIMSLGDAEPSEVLKDITEVGISCTLVALMTKNISIAYSVPLVLFKLANGFYAMGVVAPLMPSIFAEILSEINSFAFSGSLPKSILFTGLSSFGGLVRKPASLHKLEYPQPYRVNDRHFKGET